MSIADEKEILTHITEIRLCLQRIESTQEVNTKDIEKHIKRTDILDSKVHKIQVLIYLGAGAGIAEYGHNALKLLGLL